MAFIDTDEQGESFVNVTRQVSKDDGNWDDVLVVKALLDLVSEYNSKLKKAKPFNRVTVDTKPSYEMMILIRNFQQIILKRQPLGYINRATGQKQKKSYSTIWHLNSFAELVLSTTGQPLSVTRYLRLSYPLLDPILSGNGNSSNNGEAPPRERPIYF
jgi:hypothetical protein